MNWRAKTMDYKKAAVDLWTILDDIDTQDDVYKDQDRLFREATRKLIKKGREIFVSDGYQIYIEPGVSHAAWVAVTTKNGEVIRKIGE
jgi:hypothetical protein